MRMPPVWVMSPFAATSLTVPPLVPLLVTLPFRVMPLLSPMVSRSTLLPVTLPPVPTVSVPPVPVVWIETAPPAFTVPVTPRLAWS